MAKYGCRYCVDSGYCDEPARRFFTVLSYIDSNGKSFVRVKPLCERHAKHQNLNETSEAEFIVAEIMESGS
jgi:hypothetical protein